MDCPWIGDDTRRFYRRRRPRRTIEGGRRYTARNAALNRRTLEKPDANAMLAIDIPV
jgi:hypothetical protein